LTNNDCRYKITPMIKTDREPRASGILNPQDQRIAQELFDHACTNGGTVRDGSEGLTIVTVTDRRLRKSSMELHKDGRYVGQITLRLRKGRRFWHDDGAKGFDGVFMEGSKVEPDLFRPTVETRDKVLRIVHDVFVRPQPQSE